MDLNTLWFILIGVLFGGFFFLEGFDYGVAVLLPFLGKSNEERRLMINSIGPFWDGNEVWMITAGGAIFAAFPMWYATLFSGFYLVLFLILTALIIRGVSFEFRGKIESPTWQKAWDRAMFFGSLIPAALWGAAMANLIIGVPIDAKMEYAGGLGDLLSPIALLAGLTGLLVFIFHGSVFLSLKLQGDILSRALKAARKTGIAAVGAALLLIIAVFAGHNASSKPLAAVLAVMAVLVLGSSYALVLRNKFKAAMITNGLAIIVAVSSLFIGLFPRVMVSSLDPKFSLTVFNASSSPYTLKIMTIVALTLVPVVLAYQIWTYWVFRERLNKKHLEY